MQPWLENIVRRRRLRLIGALSGGSLAGFLVSPLVYGAEATDFSLQASVPIVRQAERVGVSPPLRSLEAAKLAARPIGGGHRVIPLHRIQRAKTAALSAAVAAEAAVAERDPVVQSFAFAAKTPAPTTTFEGISNADNFSVYGGMVLPPDPVGDVGPDHYVQAVNLLFQVFDKATGASLLGPMPISTLFSGFGGPCETNDDGDPIVLYDHLADRWLISQFALPVVPGTNPPIFDPPGHQCIAISQSGDPTGAYYRYDFVMPNNKLNDYPKFGVWPDAFYMSDNQFNATGTSFLGVGVFAFERDKMLVGDPTATRIYFDLESAPQCLPPKSICYSMLPADLDGPQPPAGTPNYFAYFTSKNPFFGDPQDGLRIFEFHADFTTPANSTFTERSGSERTAAAFNPVLCFVFYECIQQPGTSVKLDSLADRLMFRLQYRNFGTHETLVTNHTVNAGSGKAGIRYYELRATPPGGKFVIKEQATFAPDEDHRWMGSAAMDGAGNLALGYSVSGLNTFPSIRYAARLATDRKGGLFQGESTLQAGGGSQTSPFSRWGDYSALSVDPVEDCTFWYTQEYYSATSDRGWQTRIGSFRLPFCHDLAVVKITAKSAIKGPGPVTAPVAVKIQNRGGHPEAFVEGDLGDGITSGLVRLDVSIADPGAVEGCQPAGVVLDGAKNAALFSRGTKVLKSKKSATVRYLVTYQCNNAQPINKSDPSRGDYEHTATVFHHVLDGNADDHAADDTCPHDALPGNVDANPPPKGLADIGCGAKKPDGTRGAVVVTDVIQ